MFLSDIFPIFVCACLVSIVAEFFIAVDDQCRIIILAVMLVLAECDTEPVFYLCLDNKPLNIFILYVLCLDSCRFLSKQKVHNFALHKLYNFCSSKD